MDIRQNDLLFGKIALNKRLITRDLLNRALHYQRTQAPDKQLGEILLEKGVLTREQVDEILAFQDRVNKIKSTQGAQAVTSSFFTGGGPMPGTTGPWSTQSANAPAAMSSPAQQFNNPFNGSTAVALGPTPNPDQDP